MLGGEYAARSADHWHAPLLLGDGVRLYGGPGAGRVDLERTAIAESGQLTDLRFRVAQPGPSPAATS